MIRKALLLLAVLVLMMTIGQMIYSHLGSYLERTLIVFFAAYIFGFGTVRFSSNCVYALPYLLIYLVYAFAEGLGYDYVRYDIGNLLWTLPFVVAVFSLIETDEHYHYFMKYLCWGFATLGTIMAALSFYKLIALSQGKLLSWVDYTAPVVLTGTSLIGDNNVYASGLGICAFGFAYFYTNTQNKLLRLALHVLPLFILSASFMSGSRRSVFYILAFILFYTGSQPKSIVQFFLKNLRLAMLLLLATVIILLNADTLLNTIGINVNAESVFTIINRQSQLTQSYKFVSTRAIRWDYALDLYQQYNILQKLIGDGFGYLLSFKTKFVAIGEDYPHNFMLSALLYGGLIGLLSSLLLVFKCFEVFYRDIRKYSIPLAWFGIMILTNIMSGNSILTLRFSIFMFLFPLFILIRKKSISI